MKIRQGFVSNSSSSSFICISAGKTVIYDNMSDDGEFVEGDSQSFDIDKLIIQLQEAKASGATKLEIFYGGSYDG